MTKVYLALYKGRKSGWTPKALTMRFVDWSIRKATHSGYSHCEIAVPVAGSDRLFDCYSSSFRDGGVRCKRMPLPVDKWDLIELATPNLRFGRLGALWAETKGRPYDLTGALCVKTIFRKIWLKESADKWFCSEWCAEVMGEPMPSLCSPGDLAVFAKQGKAV